MLAEKLLGKVYDLRIYDRSVQVATLTGLNRAYIDREIPPLERLMVRRRAVGRQGGDRRARRAGGSGAPDCWACRAWGDRSGRVFRTAVSRWDCLEGLCWCQPSRGRRDVAGHPFRAAIRRPAPSFASAFKSATASPSRKPAYNRRPNVQASSIGRYKRVIGDALRSRTDQTEATEVAIASIALNRMLGFLIVASMAARPCAARPNEKRPSFRV
jgi:hypothetical protein